MTGVVVDILPMPRSTTSAGPSQVPAASVGCPSPLGVDVGGPNVQASVLDCRGALLADRARAATPVPATPAAVLQCVAALTVPLPRFDRISVGFPGVVRAGTVVTAPNLGSGHWSGFDLID